MNIDNSSLGITHQTTQTAERLAFLDDLRAVAIIMVVGIHAISYSQPMAPGLEAAIRTLFSTVAVPIFFLVDGYLAARSVQAGSAFSYLRSVRKSALRLLLPWAIFTVLYILARYLFESLGVLKEQLVVGSNFGELAVNAYASVYASQLYFLVSLFFIRLGLPMLRRLASASTATLLVLSGGYCMLFQILAPALEGILGISGGSEPLLHAFWGLQFYLLGIILFRLLLARDIKTLIVPAAGLCLVALWLDANDYSGTEVLGQYSYLILLFLGFAAYSVGSRQMSKIGRNTMGIYLMHAPILMKAVSIAVVYFISVPLLSWLTIATISLALSLIAIAIVETLPFGTLVFGAEPRGKVIEPKIYETTPLA